MSFYTFLPKLLNMSLTASVVIMFVLLLRLLLKRAPKAISYALWGIVLFRLLCPVSIESNFSLFGLFDTPARESGTLTSSIEYVPSNIVYPEHPAVVLPVPDVDDMVNDTLPQGQEQLAADPLETPMAFAAYVWMAGVLGMGIYAAVSYVRLRRKLFTAIHLRDNIWSADGITSPFVMGLFRPKIYLPNFMEQREQSYIILHEQYHIRRFDHVIKAISFVVLCIHWFNPLVWIAFIMAGKDMEMSCDEAVVKKMGEGVLADYTASLLSLATGKHIIAGMPLAFGEGDTKGRIRNLANWKKPAFWVILVSVIACVVLAVCLLTNPTSPSSQRIVLPDAAAIVSVDITTEDDLIHHTDAAWISDVIHNISESEPTDKISVQDTPNIDSYIKIDFNFEKDTSTLFAYEDNGKYYVEQPYQGIFEISSRLYQRLQNMDTAPSVQEWFDYLHSDEIPRSGRQEINLDDFPGVTFRWTPEKVEAIVGDEITLLYTGMPIWNVFFTDLTGDGFPELCSTLSIGSGIVDDSIIIYDYANGASYSLEDRMKYDYRLSLQNGQLLVTKQAYVSGEIVETGYLAYVDGTVQIIPLKLNSMELVPGATYVSYQCIYLNPLSSYAVFGGDSGCKYTVGEDFFETVNRSSGTKNLMNVQSWEWQSFPYTDEEWAALHIPAMNVISNISEVFDEIQ